MVTLIAGWVDQAGAHLFADSAETHNSSPKEPLTSFGELQALDDRTVEETTMKLVELVPGVIAAITGDAYEGIRFLNLLVPMLVQHGAEYLECGAEQLRPDVADRSQYFAVAFMHTKDGRPTITGFSPSEGVVEIASDVEGRSLVLGSAPAHLRQIVARGLAGIRQHLPAEQRHMVAAAFLQSIGILEYLPASGIAGAFFSAQLQDGTVSWQEDITYLIVPPTLFENAPAAPADGVEPPRHLAEGLEKVRCFVQNRVGFVFSSITTPQVKVLLPLNPDPNTNWPAFVEYAFPQPRSYFGTSRCVAFLSKGHRRVALLIRKEPAETSASFGVSIHGDRHLMRIQADLANMLEQPVRDETFEIRVVTENDPYAVTWGGFDVHLHP